MTQDMKQDMKKYMFMSLRYRKIYALLLAAMLTTMDSSSIMAQTQTGPKVRGNVYGGGNAANVGATSTVNISAGTIGNDGQTSYQEDHGNVFGGGKGETTVVTGNVTVNIGKEGQSSSGATIKGDVYGGSAKGKVNGDAVDATKATNVTLNKGTVNGSVYGGGLGDNTNAADVYGKVTVTVNNGTAGNVFGCNNVNGAPKSTVEVTIQGGQVTNSVYGGGNAAPYEGNPTVTMNGGSAANIYGGGLGSTAVVTGDVAVTINGGTVSTNVYGGGSEANLTGSVDVNIKGGTVTGDVYGGGAKAHTNTANWNDASGTWADGALDDGKTIRKTTVNLLGGTVGNAYGGGLGYDDTDDTKDVEAIVYGDVAVTVNGTAFTKGTGKGRVFGCNNLKGTPKGSVDVVVERTINPAGEHTLNNYEIQAVYGGGNQAPYLPVDLTNQKTKVEVKSCQTSIEYVYGGGNSASVPETNVAIEGAFEIGSVFGGGNGSEEGSLGADVTGNTNTVLYGGTIHSVFGGSNKKGTIGGDTNLNIPTPLDESGCPLQITEVYGAGREADVDHDVIIEIGCLADGVRDVYGGALNANIKGKIQMTITSGVLQNVFGGNNSGGTIEGPIIVNIEETDNCKPIKITNLYGAGNLAHYPSVNNTVAVSDPSVTVNVKACTSIDNIYGGGCNADVYGNTEVNINMVKGWWAGKTFNSEEIPNAIGTIGNVYGGGKNGKVYYSNSENKTHGNATVNIGTATTVGFVTEPIHYRPSTAPDTELTKNSTTGLYDLNVEGAKIVGDVYGGGEGNATIVDGISQVNLGSTSITYTPEVTGNIYGGSAFGTVNVAQVNLVKGTVAMNGSDTETGNVFGGGKGQNGDANATPVIDEYTAQVTGSTTVTLNNATVQNAIYGGCNTNGVVGTSGTVSDAITATVTLKSGTVGSSSATDMSALQTVFGGGLGSNTHTYGKTAVNVGVETSDDTAIYGNVYGGSRNGSIGAVAVDLKAGTIHGNVYGGGYETTANTNYVTRATDAATTVNVTVEGATFEIVNDATDATKPTTGQVFGCNNKAGSPTGHVKVEVTSIGTYTGQAVDLAAVYGGGNEADYIPDANTTDKNLEVVINANGAKINKVFGGGNAADVGDTGDNGVTAGTKVTLTDGEVKNGIYGGCNTEGTVTDDTSVTLSGGTVGAENSAGEVCGGGLGKDTKVINGTSFVYVGTGTVGDETTFAGTTTLYGDIYGGSAYGEVNNTEVDLFKLSGTSFGYNVFGGGKGNYVSEGHADNIEAKVNGTATVNMYALTISGDDDAAAVYGGCNVNGTTATAIVNLIDGTIGTSGTEANKVFGGGKGHETTTTSATVNVGSSTSVGSSTIYSNVYGGSALGAVGTAIVNLNKATSLAGHVFGGGMGSGTTTATAATITTSATVNQNNITLTSDIYGGCNVNGSAAATTVNLTGGSTANVFGGGLGQNTSVTGNVTVNVGTYDTTNGLQGNPTITADVYGGSAQGTVNTDEEATTKTTQTAVHLYAGTIGGNVYGGGLGQQARAADTEHSIPALDLIEAHVYGNVLVDLNNNNGTCKIGGGIFGCNNQAGSPKGHVTVHVYKTVARTGQTTEQYDVAAVYGGGNEADYNPTDAKLSTEVIIEGCDKTSIQNVYGGGNAAAVPASEVLILGTKKIENVFGGGNGELGEDHAAHVGFHRTMSGTTINKTNYTNGTGKTYVKLVGGTITNVYGGSNSNGDIRVGADISMPNASSYSTQDCCSTLNTTNIYGGGKNADMSGGTSIVLGCMPNQWIDEIYAGAQNADVAGNVNLTITSGKFYRVFGGNKDGGMLKGSITVNIEETGECDVPIVIGELYGGGNLAGYSVYGYYQDAEDGNKWKPRTKAQYDTWFDGLSAEDKLKPENKKYNEPQLNIRSFTSIGTVYGGGYQALMIADPHVDINVVKGSKSATARNEETIADVPIKKKNASGVIEDATITLHLPAHEANKIGAIEHVFGGGNLATVDGSATVNIGTETEIDFTSAVTHLTKNSHNKYDVEGAIITGNVYGGGNQADVTGDTQVNICAKYNATNDDYDAIEEGSAKVTISGDVFGAGKGVTTDVDAAMVSGNSTIIMMGGSVKKSVYGGGQLSQLAGNTNITVSAGTIGTAAADLPSGVTAGAIYGNVYGGGFGTADATINDYKLFGLIKGNTNVTISGGDILHNVYGGGAYGSVGEFTYDDGTTTNTGMPTGYTSGGTANVTITGGNIGTTGQENGMVFGSSRGDVDKLGTDGIDPNDRLAWVYDTHVTIGTSGVTTGPQINGSVYGSGENGHTWNDTEVRVYSGTIGVPTGTPIGELSGAAYPYRGNVYGGGCGTDKYDSDNDNVKDAYNPLAGIVQGNATITITGGKVVHNVYGAGAMGSVGTATTGGQTTITISGGTIGVDGTAGEGNVFGAARGSEDAISNEFALVRDHTTVNISNGTVYGNVYGGGELGCVGRYKITSDMRNFMWTDETSPNPDSYTYNNTGVCNVNITGGTIGVTGVAMDAEGSFANGNVFGAGKGKGDTFWCEKGIVYKSNVSVSAGTVNGNVYGGGQVGRVETDATVKVGPDTGEGAPEIVGNVFGGGAGLKTHGYSALTRGNTYVIVQGNAKVDKNVYGGGQIAAVGKYKVKLGENSPSDAPAELPVGMPYSLVSDNLGICNVTIKGSAIVGNGGSGHVFGGGKGKIPEYIYNTSNKDDWSKRMVAHVAYNSETGEGHNPEDVNTKWNYYVDDKGQQVDAYVWEYFPQLADYHQFLETLGLATQSVVNVEGSAKVNGSVYGGSESGFVQHNTSVTIKGSSTIGVSGTAETDGNVFGGGLGLAAFDKAGRVSGNTTVNVYGGTVWRNVYGGGSLGPVGNFSYVVNPTTHSKTYTWTAGGTCNVTIDALDGGTTIIKGNVFGAGKGTYANYECEPAMALQSNVTINNGTVNNTVYGGGEVGRVDQNTTVTIGKAGDNTSEPDIQGDVFGAGAGVDTHGYSALVRGNATVTIQGKAKVAKSVYGGGKTASVGRFVVDEVTSLPTKPVSGGVCTVNILGEASIGYNGGGNIFGACKGIEPGNWNELPGHKTSDENMTPFTSEADYLNFLKTLALTSNTVVNMGGSATVNGSVYGGGERGITLSGVKVDMTGGTVNKDVYGGGALADTNTENWDGTTLTKYHEETRLTSGSSVVGYYTKSGDEYTPATGTVDESTTYYRFTDTKVNLLGGMIKGDAYGGGLGRLEDTANNITAVEAKVYGDVTVTLGDEAKTNATAFDISYYTGDHANVVKSGRVFGCNNLNGSPKGDVKVTVWNTVGRNADGTLKAKPTINTGNYEVAAIYGGGNLADYIPAATSAKASVKIMTCQVSAKDVYGGGNAAAVPETDVLINGAHEIFYVFGGGNGADPYTLNNGTTWIDNSGANLGVTTTGNVTIGTGKTNTLLKGGYIHEAYGGSNEKGTIKGTVKINADKDGDCTLDCKKIVAAGRNADLDTDAILVMGCVEGAKVDQVIGGADNANVNGNVELTITSGTFGKVFGGNNLGGIIKGHIVLNIEETGCTPIVIDTLYLGGNRAAYSVYGYYDSGTTNADGKKIYLPRTSATDEHEAIENPATDATHSFPYADPVLNIVSCTKIGKVFGGGLGKQAIMYANPTVNINMIPGKAYSDEAKTQFDAVATTLGEIGDVYGGGNEADVIGNPTVNIGTAATVQLHQSYANGAYSMSDPIDVVGANITGNVFGGGMGKDDTFTCEKAMVGKEGDGLTNPDGGTTINIYKGTVNGNVYGGGEIGRVEKNTAVTIGKQGDETSAPEIRGYVFGGGKGLETHGYSALVHGNPVVTIQGSAKIGKSVYGGGQIASVGNFFVKGVTYPAELHAPTPPDDFPDGMPYALKDDNSGKCTVIVRDKAEIGPDNMKMEKRDAQNNLLRPDDLGHVFGAGKGIMPYEDTNDPKRMDQNSNWESYASNEAGYITFIETLGMTASTDVTIGGSAFVKGSVYGGSENGHVLHDTKVTIAEKCQIGNGDGKNRRYTDDEWTNENASDFAECASWPYGKKIGGTDENPIMQYLPYDVYDYVDPTAANPVPKAASDGHTYYGNVFGGGSGVFPYKKKTGWLPDATKSAEAGQPVDANGYSDGVWLRSAGAVFGNTEVNITGGHILTSVYGGNECTDVTGTSTVKMSGGTLGVPRTVDQIKKHPVTCYLFGAGKGDQRINFNTWTNIASVNVEITGGRIFGSVFGGGEDGHVMGDVTMSISEADATKPTKIGTTGTSYVDGNVFGGGRGFSGEAQTAGTVGGNITMNISGGTMLGSIYGGGRLASVGTMFEYPTLDDGTPNPAYGNFKKDDTNGTYGHITINISGGTIGKTFTPDAEGNLPVGAQYSGNVFGGSMGRLELLNGPRNPIWPKMAQVKSTEVTISGDAEIMRTVFGGGELGTVRDDATVTINGGTIRRDVYGGGYGSDDKNHTVFSVYELTSADADPAVAANYDATPHTYAYTPMQFAGCVGKSTTVNVNGGYIRKSVYGGGEMASVGVIDYRAAEATTELAADKVKIGPIEGKTYYYTNMVKHGDVNKEFALSWPYKFNYVPGYEGATHVNIKGGRLGLKDGDTDTGFEDNGDVYGAGKGMAGEFEDYLFCANVGSTDVVIDHTSSNSLKEYSGTADLIAGAVYGGGEDGHVMGNTKVTMKSGLINHSIYGAGSGKGKFEKTLPRIDGTGDYTRKIYSITAGKVFGNSTVEMSGGTVVRNVYGGGNMGSVGKGNYAGGTDDYSYYVASDKTYNGYGEALDGSLWTATSGFNPRATITETNKPTTMADHFLSSGICTVKITGGTIGYIASDPTSSMYPWNSSASLPYGNVFGGCRGEAAPNIEETPRYHYSPEFFVGYANETEVTIEGDDTKILGSVYGGGMDGHIRRDAHVIIKGGEIGIPYNAEYKGKVKTENPNDIQWLARGNVYGSGSGIGKYKYDFNYNNQTSTDTNGNGKIDDNEVEISTYHGKEIKEEDYSTSAGSVTRFTKVEILDGTIHRNVYGGGSLSSIGAPKIPVARTDYPVRRNDSDTETKGKQTLNEVIISGGHIGDALSYDANGNHIYGGNVYGGSRGSTELSNAFSTSLYTLVDINGDADVKGDVFGGGESGPIKGDVEVNIVGGSVGHDVYGGGALADTQLLNWGTDTWADATKKSALYQTKVNLHKGVIGGNVYGGGLGQKPVGTEGQTGYVPGVEAKVYGNTIVELNSNEVVVDGVKTYPDDCVVKGNIFGCNNLNGSPKGTTTVHIYKTQDWDGHGKTAAASLTDSDDSHHTYNVAAVYGGGNLAAYEPIDLENAATNVIIDGCGLTSIRQVYAGGNAASVPASCVTVNGTYEIEEVFGGGNGKDAIGKDADGNDIPNPGANVGFYDYSTVEATFDTKEKRQKEEFTSQYVYGSGKAEVNIFGGTIHRVFGGSNTKGNVRQSAITLLEDAEACAFCVDEAYGGGKSAPMDAEAKLLMACIPGLREVYGGAQAADVYDDVTVTVTNGNFDRVFGGNNLSGTIRGSITVNIEETGCRPVIIGELYGGGNQAGYSVYGYNDDGTIIESGEKPLYADPQVNVRSFTSIGTIYGGGYGAGATMVANPTVNINESVGNPDNYPTTGDYDDNGFKGKTITVDGHEVTLPSHTKGKIGAINNVFGGGNAAKVIGNTNVNVGTETTQTYVSVDDNPATETKENVKEVTGADIRGNVYGGGNNAEVTGNTNVQIGKKTE